MYLHIEIDSFFTSAERSINPELKGVPIAVASRSNLDIFNKNRTNIKLMNDNSGAFVTLIYDSNKKRHLNLFLLDNLNGKQTILR
ncbi:MAG: DNA polymerase IV (EC [uncultured Sulfurovum sp.]|uniref:DNA polymerase IV (EC) n=1 Tax=uncultured Sulfurovum sp. TaxID=269237 RepID=A0A6S6TY02_9BACT|nr:MAG: DNA polymerase IV (EC [uncultured Sulfurovum sp.]